MNTLDLPLSTADLHELDALQLSVARRADDLRRLDAGRNSARDFWREAEAEIWAERLISSAQPAPAWA
jgi:hypothetical protein